jgi:hypothetical protein
MQFMRIPTSGTGTVNAALACSPGNKDIYLADLADVKNLVEDFQHITLEQVMAFSSWFMGSNGQLMTICHLSNMTMKYIDVNAAGNHSLVSCFKQELRTVSCLVWHTIKNHLTTLSY